ncbi:MAG: 3-hydroxylacyl-ACP dehydratase [Steroidobacteraceae bacterium]
MPLAIDRAWIERHIPHQGRMCLIDEVVDWSADRIVCSSGGHRAADHPLRAHGRLGIACGIELAAQAMAVHGALLAEGAADRPRAGLLASIRGVRMWALRLDDVESDLLCQAVRIMGDQSTALYEFELRSSASRLISGRAAVVLDVGRIAPDGPRR